MTYLAKNNDNKYIPIQPWLLPLVYVNPLSSVSTTECTPETTLSAIKGILLSNGLDPEPMVSKSQFLQMLAYEVDQQYALENYDGDNNNSSTLSSLVHSTQVDKIYQSKINNEICNYIRDHKVWIPQGDYVTFTHLISQLPLYKDYIENLKPLESSNVEDISDNSNLDFLEYNTCKPEPASQPSSASVYSENHQTTDGAHENFISVTYCPKMYGPSPIPPLMHHCSTAINGKIYIFGGLVSYYYDNKNFTVAETTSSYFKAKDNQNYPFPLKSSVFNNPETVPNRNIYVLNIESNIISIPKVMGDIPPEGISGATATVINDRYIFYFGGFTLNTEYAEDQSELDDGVIMLDRSIEYNTKAWILDICLMEFIEVPLMHDGLSDFKLLGHSCTIIPTMSSTSSPSSCEACGVSTKSEMYVFGGVTESSSILPAVDNEPVPICTNKMYKIELEYTPTGSQRYLNFKFPAVISEVLIPNNVALPCARSCHASTLCDDQALKDIRSGEYYSDSVATDSPKPQNKLPDYSVLIHGGCNFVDILGDLWKFNVKSQQWSKIETLSHSFNADCSPRSEIFPTKFDKASHGISLIDKYLVFTGGFNEEYVVEPLQNSRKKAKFYNSFITSHNEQSDSSQKVKHQQDFGYVLDHSNERTLPDATNIASQLVRNLKKKYLRIIILDLTTNTFMYVRSSNDVTAYTNLRSYLNNERLCARIRSFSTSHWDDEMVILCQQLVKYIQTVPRNSKAAIEARGILRKLYFAMRIRPLFTEHFSTIGSTTVYSNGKICCIGGVLLVPESHKRETKKINPNSPFTEVSERGHPLGTITTLELPIFSHPKNFYEDNDKVGENIWLF
ncbi:hypothetical protein DASC09_005990 [Saccharomycopsis crataegensis]|uniref:Uncharacterized protein n=1 Tax=Saccharomycopsis crataegensis TaxID=43959 RepID=A0AAV5QF33_9ASCO|nr:hypothetical protein DASC09_005990 [Saccharomycopsis crataegensis]